MTPAQALRLHLLLAITIAAIEFTALPVHAWCHIKHREGTAALGTLEPVPVFAHPTMFTGGMVHPDGTQWSPGEIIDSIRWTLEMANASAHADLTHAPLYYAGIAPTLPGCDPSIDPVSTLCRFPGAIILQRQAEDTCDTGNTVADSIRTTGTTIQFSQNTFTSRDVGGNIFPGTPCARWGHLTDVFSGGIGFEGALLHELGHAFGLAHNSPPECDTSDRINICSGIGLASERCAVMNFGAGSSYVAEGWLPDDLDGLAHLRDGIPGTIREFANIRIYETEDSLSWHWFSIAPSLDSQFGANPRGLPDGSTWLVGRDWYRPQSGTRLLRSGPGVATWSDVATIEASHGSPAIGSSRSGTALVALQREPRRRLSTLRVPVYSATAGSPPGLVTTFRPRWADPGLEPDLMSVSSVYRQGGVSIAYDPIGDSEIAVYRDGPGSIRLLVFDPDQVTNPLLGDFQLVDPSGEPVIAAGPASIVCRPAVAGISSLGSCLVVWATSSDGPYGRGLGFALLSASPAFGQIDVYEYGIVDTPMHRPPQAALIRDGNNEYRFMVAWSRTLGSAPGDLDAEVVTLTREVALSSPWVDAARISATVPFDFRVASSALVSTPPPVGGAAGERGRVYISAPSTVVVTPPPSP